MRSQRFSERQLCDDIAQQWATLGTRQPND